MASENRDQRYRLVAGIAQKIDKGVPEGMEFFAIRLPISKALADTDGMEVPAILRACARHPRKECRGNPAPALRWLVGESIRKKLLTPFVLGLRYEIQESDSDQVVMKRDCPAAVVVLQRLGAFVGDANEENARFFFLADVSRFELAKLIESPARE